MTEKAVSIVVTGHVQGVGYRAFVLRHARSLGLTGWVRNCADGSVELTAQGTGADIDALIALLKRGPVASRVENVAVSGQIVSDQLGEFTIR